MTAPGTRQPAEDIRVERDEHGPDLVFDYGTNGVRVSLTDADLVRLPAIADGGALSALTEAVRELAEQVRAGREPGTGAGVPRGPAWLEAYEQGKQDTATRLLAEIKQREDENGTWPADNVVDTLIGWFTRQGLDVLGPGPRSCTECGEIGQPEYWHHTAEHDTARSLYTARFRPQAWVRDEAIDTDLPAGETGVWDCTAFARQNLRYLDEMAEQHGEQDGTVLDADDLFRVDPAAPQWIREWSGPFTIRVARAEPDDEDAGEGYDPGSLAKEDRRNDWQHEDPGDPADYTIDKKP